MAKIEAGFGAGAFAETATELNKLQYVKNMLETIHEFIKI